MTWLCNHFAIHSIEIFVDDIAMRYAKNGIHLVERVLELKMFGINNKSLLILACPSSNSAHVYSGG
jgi:hypothetical protein